MSYFCLEIDQITLGFGEHYRVAGRGCLMLGSMMGFMFVLVNLHRDAEQVLLHAIRPLKPSHTDKQLAAPDLSGL